MKSNMLKHALILALSTTGLVGFVAPAMAQEAAAPTAAADEGDSGAIIVSARRRDETLQSTPVAITAVNAAMLENKAALTIGDLTGAAPNLLITNQNSGAAAANLSIRGLTYADIEKSAEPTVGVVVDGVFIGTSTGQFFDFFDIAQIEVLRGPQGTLFGRNTIGGVINIQRSRPTGEFGGKVEVSYGRFNSLQTRAVINTPLVGDALAAKFFYFHNDSDGWYKQGGTGASRGWSNSENFGASLQFKPTGGSFDALLTVEKQVMDYDTQVASLANSNEVFCSQAGIDATGALYLGDAYVPGSVSPAPAEQCNRNNKKDVYTVFGDPSSGHYTAPSGTLEMNLDLGGIKLTSVTGYRESKENQTQDFDGTSRDFYYVRRLQNYKQWSQELRGSGKFGDSFDYVAGLYYFSSKYNLHQYTRFMAELFAPSAIGLDPALYDPNSQMVGGTNKSFAVFGDFNWAFADRFRLSFGGRWTQDKKSLSNAFATDGLIGTGSATFKKFTPKVGVDYRPTDQTMIYASWSRGYRSGGFSPRAATAVAAATPYQPETVDSFEVGAKLDMLDRKLQFNVAAFASKYKGLQQNTTIPGGPTGNQTITANVGSAQIKGIEGDFTFRPVHGLKFTGSFGFLDNNLKNFITQSAHPGSAVLFDNYDYSSVDMIYAPKFSGALGVEYTQPTSFGEVIGNVGFRHIGRYDQQISLGTVTLVGTNPDGSNNYAVLNNDPRVRNTVQNLLDASLTANFSINNMDAKFTLWGRNLANSLGTTHAFTVAGLWSFGTAREPRTYGATLGLKF